MTGKAPSPSKQRDQRQEDDAARRVNIDTVGCHGHNATIEVDLAPLGGVVKGRFRCHASIIGSAYRERERFTCQRTAAVRKSSGLQVSSTRVDRSLTLVTSTS